MTYKCPKCGSELYWEPDSSDYKAEYVCTNTRCDYTLSITGAVRQLAEEREKVKRLRAVLGSVEWARGQWTSPGGWKQVCPICGRDKRTGHRDGCELGAALAETETKP